MGAGRGSRIRPARPCPRTDRLEAGATGRDLSRQVLGPVTTPLYLPCAIRPTWPSAVHEVLFADPLQRATLRALMASASLHEAIDGADDEVADLLRRLAVAEPEADPEQTVVALTRAAAQVALGEIEAEARQAEAEGELTRLAAAGSAITWLKSELEIMQEPGAGDHTSPAVREAANRLVGWLLQRDLETR